MRKKKKKNEKKNERENSEVERGGTAIRTKKKKAFNNYTSMYTILGFFFSFSRETL